MNQQEHAMFGALSTLRYIEDLIKDNQLLDVHGKYKEKTLGLISQSKMHLETALAEIENSNQSERGQA